MTIFGGTLGGRVAGGGGGGTGAPADAYDSGDISYGGTSVITAGNTTTINDVPWTWRTDGTKTLTEDGSNGLQITSSGNGYGWLTIDVNDVDASYSDNNFYLIQMQTTWTTANNGCLLMVGIGEDNSGNINERYVAGHYRDTLWRPGTRVYGNTGAYRNQLLSTQSTASPPANARLAAVVSMEMGAMGGEMRDLSGPVALDGTSQMDEAEFGIPAIYADPRATVAGTHFIIEAYASAASGIDVHINRLEIYKINLVG